MTAPENPVCPRCKFAGVGGVIDKGYATEPTDDLQKADLYECLNCGYTGMDVC